MWKDIWNKICIKKTKIWTKRFVLVSVAEKCPCVCRNFCTPQNLFWCKLRYKTLMGRKPPFFYHILTSTFIFFWNFTQIFGQFWVATCEAHSKIPKVPKKGNRYLFLYFFFWYSYWLLSSINIFFILLIVKMVSRSPGFVQESGLPWQNFDKKYGSKEGKKEKCSQ